MASEIPSLLLIFLTLVCVIAVVAFLLTRRKARHDIPDDPPALAVRTQIFLVLISGAVYSCGTIADADFMGICLFGGLAVTLFCGIHTGEKKIVAHINAGHNVRIHGAARKFCGGEYPQSWGIALSERGGV